MLNYLWLYSTGIYLVVSTVSSYERLLSDFKYLRCNLHWCFKFELVFQIKDVRAYCLCASLLRTQIHIEQMAIAIALLGFNDIGSFVTPIFWDLQPLWPSSLIKLDLFRFRCSSWHVLSKTKSVSPHSFVLLTSLTHHLSMVKFQKKISVRKSLREPP